MLGEDALRLPELVPDGAVAAAVRVVRVRGEAMTAWPKSLAAVRRASELGRVTLLTNNGALLYFNRTALLGGTFDKLQRGDVVHYIESAGDAGPVASKVWLGPEHDID